MTAMQVFNASSSGQLAGRRPQQLPAAASHASMLHRGSPAQQAAASTPALPQLSAQLSGSRSSSLPSHSQRCAPPQAASFLGQDQSSFLESAQKLGDLDERRERSIQKVVSLLLTEENRLVLKYTGGICYTPDAELLAKARTVTDFLLGFGFKLGHIKSLILFQPLIFVHEAYDISKMLVYMTGELGYSPEETIELLFIKPNIITMDVDNKLKPFLKYSLESQLLKPQHIKVFMQTLLQQPHLLEGNIKYNVGYLHTRLLTLFASVEIDYKPHHLQTLAEARPCLLLEMDEHSVSRNKMGEALQYLINNMPSNIPANHALEIFVKHPNLTSKLIHDEVNAIVHGVGLLDPTPEQQLKIFTNFTQLIYLDPAFVYNYRRSTNVYHDLFVPDSTEKYTKNSISRWYWRKEIAKIEAKNAIKEARSEARQAVMEVLAEKPNILFGCTYDFEDWITQVSEGVECEAPPPEFFEVNFTKAPF